METVKDVKNTAANMMGLNDAKQRDLAQNTKEMSTKDRLTTDYGVKHTTADDWLKVVSGDKTGPALLEDPFARERVSTKVCTHSG